MKIPRPLRILVVDDDEVMSRTVSLALKKAGFFPDSASEGQAGLKKLSNGKFDLVILDLVMPGIGGFDVLREMRKRGIDVPVVVLSLLRQDEDLKLAKELGATECFGKSSPAFMTDIVKFAERLSVS